MNCRLGSAPCCCAALPCMLCACSSFCTSSICEAGMLVLLLLLGWAPELGAAGSRVTLCNRNSVLGFSPHMLRVTVPMLGCACATPQHL